MWVNERKIAAIGMRISKYVTKHGFALNNDIDLEYFEGMIPCGLNNKQATSLLAETGRLVADELIKKQLICEFQQALNTEIAFHN